MKKTTLLAMGVALMLATTSCLKEPKNEYTLNSTVPVFNLFTSIDGTAQPFVGSATYTFTIKIPDYNIKLEAKGVEWPGSTAGNGSFETPEAPITFGYADIDGYRYEVLTFESKNASESNPRITDMKGALTQGVFAPPLIDLPDYKRIVPSSSLHYAFVDFTLNGAWRVRSFWPDMTFRGRTTVTADVLPDPYVDEKIMYRVVMNYGKQAADYSKADMVIYNAKFNSKAMEATLVLKDLTLTFSDEGYRLTGEKIVPLKLTDDKLVEYPEYTLDKIDFAVSGADLTAANCSFSIADLAKGTFSGSCIKIEVMQE